MPPVKMGEGNEFAVSWGMGGDGNAVGVVVAVTACMYGLLTALLLSTSHAGGHRRELDHYACCLTLCSARLRTSPPPIIKTPNP